MKKTPQDPLAQRIAAALADRIVSGQLAPETPLRQDHLAAEFGASHVPVREALRLLEAQGLAESQPRKGCRVTSFELEDIHEVALLRATLEVLALRHAAPRLTRSVLEAAEQANHACETATEVRAWEAANRKFHRILLTPCAMPRLLASIDALHLASARFLFSAWRSAWEAPTDHDHRAILAALKRGHSEVACTILTRHLSRVGRGQPRKYHNIADGYAISG